MAQCMILCKCQANVYESSEAKTFQRRISVSVVVDVIKTKF